MISIQQLEYIVAVDRYRHFATAAEHCFITQANLSIQIKKLEDTLQVKLFDRSRQPVVPTEIGKLVIEQARKTINSTNSINSIITEYKENISGELRLGIIPTLTPYLLPLFAGKFSTIYPDVNLTIEERYTNELEELIAKDLIDIAIVVTPLKNDKLIEKPLFYEKMQVYVNREHKLAKKKELSVSDLTASDMWLLGDGHCFRHQIVNLCRTMRVDRSLPFFYDGGSLDTVMKIIDKEGGYTLIPELASNTIPFKNRSIIKEFKDSNPIREVSLIYNKHYTRRKLISCLEDIILSSIPKEMQDVSRGELVEWR